MVAIFEVWLRALLKSFLATYNLYNCYYYIYSFFNYISYSYLNLYICGSLFFITSYLSILRSFAYDNIVLLVGQGERAGPTGARDAETKGEDRDVEGGEEKEGEAWSFLEDVHEHNYPVIEIRREAFLEFITIKMFMCKQRKLR